MLMIAITLAALLIGVAAALYFKRRSSRSEQEKRAEALSKILAGEIATGGPPSSGSAGGDFDGDD